MASGHLISECGAFNLDTWVEESNILIYYMYHFLMYFIVVSMTIHYSIIINIISANFLAMLAFYIAFAICLYHMYHH